MLLSPKTWPVVMGTVVALLVLAAPAGAWTRDVHPGESIQAAIDAANPGDTIRVAAGVYHENLTITKDGVPLRGEGASPSGTVLTPGTIPPSICSDPESGAVNGVCVAGQFGPQTGEPGRPVSRVAITGFLIEGFSGDGVVAFVADDLTVKGTKAQSNKGYGISGSSSAASASSTTSRVTTGSRGSTSATHRTLMHSRSATPRSTTARVAKRALASSSATPARAS